MPDFTFELVGPLLRSSAFLATSAIVVWCLLKLLKIESVRVHTAAWLIVLLQGLVFASFAIEIEVPVTSPVSHHATNSAANSAISDSVVVDLVDDAGWRSAASDVETEFVPLVDQFDVAHAVQANDVAGDWSSGTLFTIWILGFGIVVGGMVVSYARFLRCLSDPHRPENQWLVQWERIQGESHSGKSIEMHVTQALGPAICWTPSGYRLLIPQDVWQELDTLQREAILRHEIAHFHRKDLRNALLYRLIAAVHWFNPFAWLAVRRLSECAEWSCDDFVRKFDSVRSTEYVRALVKLSTPHNQVPVVIPAASGHSLIRRTQRLLKPQLKEDTGMKKLTMTLLIAALVLTNVLSFELVAQEADAETTITTTTTTTIRTNAESKKAQSPSTDLPTSRVTSKDATLTLTGDLQIAPGQPITVTPSSGLTLPQPDRLEIPLTSRQTPVASNEAVIDLAYVFKHLPEFNKLKAALQEELETADKIARADAKSIAEMVKKLPHLSGEERRVLATDLAERQAKIKINITMVREDLKNREAQNYLQVYKRVRKAIAEHAKENGIRIVRRFEREQQKKLEAADPASILQAMNQQVLYVADDSIDITDAILERLSRDKKDAKSPRSVSIAVPARDGNRKVFSFYTGFNR